MTPIQSFAWVKFWHVNKRKLVILSETHDNHCRPRVRNTLWFGQKLGWVAKLIQFYIFHGMPNDSPPYTEFQILINSFTANPRHCQMCVGYICARSAPHGRDAPQYEKWYNIIISTDFQNIFFPNVLTLLNPVQPKRWMWFIEICMW